MPNRGRHEFTVQEAVNMDSFVSWNYETIAFDDEGNYQNYQYITSQDPAKKVVIYNTPGDAAFDDDETITIKLNGEADSDREIVIDYDDLPFTLTGLMINQLDIKTSNDTTTNDLSALSFH
tara:strand:- start:237 stop:599 length:363 start_codon:yes stop_codon:yes gene_type:complete